MIIKILDIFPSSEQAHITAYIQPLYPLCPSRPSIIICPGGAYQHVSEKEAEPAAIGFYSQGYNAFVLSYSTGIGIGNLPAPVVQLAKTVAHIRQNAKVWAVDPGKIAICGFSAGGHIAALFGSLWNQQWLEEIMNIKSEIFKPNALLLCYPLLDIKKFCDMHMKINPSMQTLIESVYLNLFSKTNPSQQELDKWDAKKLINEYMPPTFLWTTLKDEIVDISQSLEFVYALSAHDIPFEYHVFEKGMHGLSSADALSGYSKSEIEALGNAPRWRELAIKWLEDRFSI